LSEVRPRDSHRQRPATKAQKEEAQRLGIEFDDRMTYVDLKKKIEAAKAAKHTDEGRS
jgi:hypothetical protein